MDKQDRPQQRHHTTARGGSSPALAAGIQVPLSRAGPGPAAFRLNKSRCSDPARGGVASGWMSSLRKKTTNDVTVSALQN